MEDDSSILTHARKKTPPLVLIPSSLVLIPSSLGFSRPIYTQVDQFKCWAHVGGEDTCVETGSELAASSSSS